MTNGEGEIAQTIDLDAVDLSSLRGRKRKALIALVETGQVTAAADAAGVSRSTVYAYLTDPEFLGALDALSWGTLQVLDRHLATLAADSVKAIRDGLQESQDIAIRLRAADLYLGRLLAIHERVTAARELERVEKVLDNELQDQTD